MVFGNLESLKSFLKRNMICFHKQTFFYLTHKLLNVALLKDAISYQLLHLNFIYGL
jgi:hypothetical protein